MIKLLKKEIGINKTTFLNLLSTILLQGIAFLTIPIFTRVLGSEQFGLYAVFNSWVSIFSILISLSIGSCLAPGKYYYKDEYYNFRNNIIVFSTAICFVTTIVLIILYNQINLILLYDFKLYIIMLLTSFSSNTIGLITGVLVYEKKALMNFALSIFLSLSNVVLSLYFIYNLDFANIYEGKVYGHFVPYFVVSLFLIIYIIMTKPFNIDFKYLKYGLLVGTPVMFHQLAHFGLGQSDRVMMQKMCVLPSDIGIYSLFYSFCNVLAIIFNALNISFVPFYYEYIDRNDKDNIIKKSKNLIELFTILCIGFLLLSREVSYVMANRQYYSGINMIPIFVGSVYFNFMYLFSVNYEFFYRRTKTIAGGTICAAVLNIILNLFFIRIFGMYGAAYATLLSYGTLFIFHYVISNRIPEKRFYVPKMYYIIGFLSILLFIYLFFVLSSFIYVRWLLGSLIGMLEFYRIVKRKAVF